MTFICGRCGSVIEKKDHFALSNNFFFRHCLVVGCGVVIHFPCEMSFVFISIQRSHSEKNAKYDKKKKNENKWKKGEEESLGKNCMFVCDPLLSFSFGHREQINVNEKIIVLLYAKLQSEEEKCLYIYIFIAKR